MSFKTRARILVACASLVVSFGEMGSAQALAAPQPWPTMTHGTAHAARAVLNGFSEAVLRRQAGRARTFLTPQHAAFCGAWRGKAGRHYLRCLLAGTPLPVAYRIQHVEYVTLAETDVDATIIYRLPNGHYQPLDFYLLPWRSSYRIANIGVPQG